MHIMRAGEGRLQHIYTSTNPFPLPPPFPLPSPCTNPTTPCHTQQHPVKPSNTLSHPTTPCHTLSHPVTPNNSPSHPTTHCHTQQHPVTPQNTLSHPTTPCHTQQLPAAAAAIKVAAECRCHDYYYHHLPCKLCPLWPPGWLTDVVASWLASASSRTRTTSTWPSPAAMMRGVQPSSCAGRPTRVCVCGLVGGRWGRGGEGTQQENNRGRGGRREGAHIGQEYANACDTA